MLSSRPDFLAIRISSTLRLFVKRRIECVEVFAVEFILNDTHGFANTINMKYFIFLHKSKDRIILLREYAHKSTNSLVQR